jgi:hypothetical protein
MQLNFFDQLSIYFQTQNIIKIHPLGDEFSIRADGQAEGQTSDLTKLIFAFRNFANAPENNSILADTGVMPIE